LHSQQETQDRRTQAKLVAEYVQLQQAVYHARQLLQDKAFDESSERNATFSRMKDSITYQNWRNAIICRNQKASLIAKESERCEQALAIYQLDYTTIQHQAKAHQARERDKELGRKRPSFKTNSAARFSALAYPFAEVDFAHIYE
jgi:hypothetical protein